MDSLARTLWPRTFWPIFFSWGGQFGQTREYYTLTMNNNLNYQYLFGKQSIIEQLHEKNITYEQIFKLSMFIFENNQLPNHSLINYEQLHDVY